MGVKTSLKLLIEPEGITSKHLREETEFKKTKDTSNTYRNQCWNKNKF